MQLIIKKILRLKRKYHIWKHHKRIKHLVKNGLKLGKNVWIMSTVKIDNIYPFLISIGDNCSLAPGVQILAHDGTTTKYNGGYERIGRVDIKENCNIGSNTIILPGVTIGPNVMVAAGSLVNKSIAPNSCIAGVPARFYAKFDEMIHHHKEIISKSPHYDHNDFNLPIDEKFKENLEKDLQDQTLFVFVGDRKNPYKIS